ncbi:MAG TPA: YciI family protein [Flavihumibacter sp.]|jgi:uncharacterized protein YciI
MYIIELTYKVPVAEIDAAMADHIEYIDKYYQTGNFLASGRKEPRDGGLIFAKASSRAEIEAIVAEDPFYKSDMASYRIIQFKATKKIKTYDDFAGDE